MPLRRFRPPRCLVLLLLLLAVGLPGRSHGNGPFGPGVLGPFELQRWQAFAARHGVLFDWQELGDFALAQGDEGGFLHAFGPRSPTVLMLRLRAWLGNGGIMADLRESGLGVFNARGKLVGLRPVIALGSIDRMALHHEVHHYLQSRFQPQRSALARFILSENARLEVETSEALLEHHARMESRPGQQGRYRAASVAQERDLLRGNPRALSRGPGPLRHLLADAADGLAEAPGWMLRNWRPVAGAGALVALHAANDGIGETAKGLAVAGATGAGVRATYGGLALAGRRWALARGGAALMAVGGGLLRRASPYAFAADAGWQTGRLINRTMGRDARQFLSAMAAYYFGDPNDVYETYVDSVDDLGW
jgi:hypothetical protein